MSLPAVSPVNLTARDDLVNQTPVEANRTVRREVTINAKTRIPPRGLSFTTTDSSMPSWPGPVGWLSAKKLTKPTPMTTNGINFFEHPLCEVSCLVPFLFRWMHHPETGMGCNQNRYQQDGRTQTSTSN